MTKGEERGGLSTFFPWKGGLIRDGGNIWERGFNRGFTVPKCTDENDERNELDSVLSRIATNRPFPHSCKQTHQLEAWVDKIQWFVWNCPPEPRSHFFMFAHWSVMRERSIAAIFWKNCFSVIKHNPFQWAYLTSALWAKRGKRRGIYVGCKLREAWEGICQRKFPTEVRVAAQQRVSTKFLKLKQSITREKLNRKPQREVCHCDRTWKVRDLKEQIYTVWK